MTFSTASFTVPNNVLHGMVEPQWFPADPHDVQSKLTALEQAEQAYSNRLKSIVESQPKHPLPNLKNLPTNHHYHSYHNYPSHKAGRRRKVRLSDSIASNGGSRSSSASAVTTPTVTQGRPPEIDTSVTSAQLFARSYARRHRSTRSRRNSTPSGDSSSATSTGTFTPQAGRTSSDTAIHGAPRPDRPHRYVASPTRSSTPASFAVVDASSIAASRTLLYASDVGESESLHRHGSSVHDMALDDSRMSGFSAAITAANNDSGDNDETLGFDMTMCADESDADVGDGNAVPGNDESNIDANDSRDDDQDMSEASNPSGFWDD